METVGGVSDKMLDARVLGMVIRARGRLTPLEPMRRIKQTGRAVGRDRIESAIKRLVEQKELVYTYPLGNSFLEPSFEKPVRVANSIVVKPPACDYDPLPTLLAYFDKMAALMEKDGRLVISGIKSNEIKTMKRVSGLRGMQVCWESTELDWGALVLRQKEESLGV